MPIYVSSSNALFGNTAISSFAPAKAGMISFTKSLAVTYGPHGMRAKTITPACTLTEKKLKMFANNQREVRRSKIVYPLGNPAHPEQVAEVMLFLASDESSAITRHSLVADRGGTVFNPLAVPERLEADICEVLEAKGSNWIEGE